MLILDNYLMAAPACTKSLLCNLIPLLRFLSLKGFLIGSMSLKLPIKIMVMLINGTLPYLFIYDSGI